MVYLNRILFLILLTTLFWGDSFYDLSYNGEEIRNLSIACLLLMAFSYFSRFYEVVGREREGGRPEGAEGGRCCLPFFKGIDNNLRGGIKELYIVSIFNFIWAFEPIDLDKNESLIVGVSILVLIAFTRFVRMSRWLYLIKSKKHTAPEFLNGVSRKALTAGVILVLLSPGIVYLFKGSVPMMTFYSLVVCLFLLAVAYVDIITLVFIKGRKAKVFFELFIGLFMAVLLFPITVVPFFINGLARTLDNGVYNTIDGFKDPYVFSPEAWVQIIMIALFTIVIVVLLEIYFRRARKDPEGSSAAFLATKRVLLGVPLLMVLTVILMVFTVNTAGKYVDDTFDIIVHGIDLKRSTVAPDSLNAEPIMSFVKDSQEYGDDNGIYSARRLFEEVLDGEEAGVDEALGVFTAYNSEALRLIKEASKMPVFHIDEPATKDMTLFELFEVPIDSISFQRNAHTALLVETLYYIEAGDMVSAEESIEAARKLLTQLVEINSPSIVSAISVALMAKNEKNLREHLLSEKNMPGTFFAGLDEFSREAMDEHFKYASRVEELVLTKAASRSSIYCLEEGETYDNFGAAIPPIYRFACPYLTVMKSFAGTGEVYDISRKVSAVFKSFSSTEKNHKQRVADYEIVYFEYLEALLDGESMHIFSKSQYTHLADVYRYYLRKQVGLANMELIEASEAVMKFKTKYKKYPTKISDLNEFREDSLTDPFGDGDTPLRMKTEDGRLVIYSVGPDGVDDGGTPIDTSEGVKEYTKGDVVFEINI